MVNDMEKGMEKDLEECLTVLRSGGIIVYPTDTVWGIGCDATNAEAVAKIYALKRRSDSKSMLSLLDSEENLQKWVAEIPQTVRDILKENERPTTIIYASPDGLAENLLAEDGSAGIRISRESFSRELCRRFGKPIVSTSANISGSPAASYYDEISPEILRGADYVAGYGRDCRKPAAPSRILKISPLGEVIIIRN